MLRAVARTPNKNIIAGYVYKPPSASFNDFMLTFHDLQNFITPENKSCLISVDCNINIPDIDNHNQSHEFKDTIIAHSCIPVIINPTKITSTYCIVLVLPPIRIPLIQFIFVNFPVTTCVISNRI